ncbi:MAG TPA: hypothetical protein DCP54_02800 [Chryseobacterium sp.]|nr:hypothetical protein [Chryseobacterium sp.]
MLFSQQHNDKEKILQNIRSLLPMNEVLQLDNYFEGKLTEFTCEIKIVEFSYKKIIKSNKCFDKNHNNKEYLNQSDEYRNVIWSDVDEVDFGYDNFRYPYITISLKNPINGYMIEKIKDLKDGKYNDKWIILKSEVKHNSIHFNVHPENFEQIKDYIIQLKELSLNKSN